MFGVPTSAAVVLASASALSKFFTSGELLAYTACFSAQVLKRPQTSSQDPATLTSNRMVYS